MKAYEDPFVDLGSHSERVIEKMDVFLRDVFFEHVLRFGIRNFDHCRMTSGILACSQVVRHDRADSPVPLLHGCDPNSLRGS